LYEPANSKAFFQVILDLSDLEIVPKELVTEHVFFFLKDLEKYGESQRQEDLTQKEEGRTKILQESQSSK